jgi:hypothetical protein
MDSGMLPGKLAKIKLRNILGIKTQGERENDKNQTQMAFYCCSNLHKHAHDKRDPT